MMYYLSNTGWFWMILFFGLIIWLIIWLVSRTTVIPKQEKTPLQIAKERFARGELTKKEYRDIVKELRETVE